MDDLMQSINSMLNRSDFINQLQATMLVEILVGLTDLTLEDIMSIKDQHLAEAFEAHFDMNWNLKT